MAQTMPSLSQGNGKEITNRHSAVHLRQVYLEGISSRDRGGNMQHESGYWWQPALQSAIHDTGTIGSKIGLAKMIILGRLVSPADLGREEEDALFEALDELRALEWQQLQ